MFKFLLLTFGLLLAGMLLFLQTAKAEEIHFNNNVYYLKKSFISPVNNGYENEYFLKNENADNWTKMVGVYHYPNTNNPIKFAENESKTLENTETDVLLKFIANKKTNKAALSYLENGSCGGKNYFEYNIYKYEKHDEKGIIGIRYAIRYFFDTKDQIPQIAEKVKAQNDEYLETMILSPIPKIIEKEIDLK